MAKTINVELNTEDAQELAFTVRATIKRIDYVLETNPPQKKGAAQDLDNRAKQLTLIAVKIEEALHQRALG